MCFRPSELMMNPPCPQCGQTTKLGEFNCRNCGADLTGSDSPSTAPEPPTAPSAPLSAPSAPKIPKAPGAPKVGL